MNVSAGDMGTSVRGAALAWHIRVLGFVEEVADRVKHECPRATAGIQHPLF